MSEIMALLEYEALGNPLSAWLLALVAFLATFTLLPLLRGYVSRWADRHFSKARPVVFELALRLIARTSRLFIWIVAIKAGESFLELPPTVHRGLTVLVVVGAWIQVALWGMAAIAFFLERQQRVRGATDTAFASSLAVINFVAGLAVWGLVALLALDNLGINITALVAGLGIGGIAIALAVQTILSDLLASLSITLDKPFAIGDSITVGEFTGNVEHIGIKSTRLRSVSGEQIIMANADLLKSRVRNFGRMGERRAVITIGIRYETPHVKVAQVAELIAAAIRAQPGVRFERCHFKEFGPHGLVFEAVLFALQPSMDALMDAMHDINLRLLGTFADQNIELAYPTQRILVDAAGGQRLAAS